MLDEILLYDLTASPYCLKARICLQLKGIAYRRVTLTLGRRRELRRLNPIGKVPVLVHGSEVVADSSRIARYLEEHFPDPALLPSDPAARAYCALLEDWADEALHFVCAALKWLNPSNRAVALRGTVPEVAPGVLRPLVGLIVRRHVERRYRAWRYSKDSLPYFADQMRENLAMLAALLADKPYLLGRAPTVADIAIFAQLAQLGRCVEARLIRAEPTVVKWLARLDAEPAIAAALTA